MKIFPVQVTLSRLWRMVPVSLTVIVALALTSGCETSYSSGAKVVSAAAGELTIRDEKSRMQQTHQVAQDAKITLDARPANLEDLDQGDAVDVKFDDRNGAKVVREIKATSKEAMDAKSRAQDPATKRPAEKLPAEKREANKPILESNDDDALGEPPTPAEQDRSEAPALPSKLPPLSKTPAIDPQNAKKDLRRLEPAEKPNTKQQQPANRIYQGKIASKGDNQFDIVDEGNQQHSFLVNDQTKYTLNGKEATFPSLKVDHFVKVAAEEKERMLLAKTVDAFTEQPAKPAPVKQ